jgi:hypothetical protein
MRLLNKHEALSSKPQYSWKKKKGTTFSFDNSTKNDTVFLVGSRVFNIFPDKAKM